MVGLVKAKPWTPKLQTFGVGLEVQPSGFLVLLLLQLLPSWLDVSERFSDSGLGLRSRTWGLEIRGFGFRPFCLGMEVYRV